LARAFKLKGNIRIRGRELPVTAIIGLVATLAIWVVIVTVQEYSRWTGMGWMAFGLVVYAIVYRRRRAREAKALAEAQ
jgi:amino acid transporter